MAYQGLLNIDQARIRPHLPYDVQLRLLTKSGLGVGWAQIGRRLGVVRPSFGVAWA
jgi:hypothetical protein